MNADELWDTTMDPEKRTLLKVTVEQASIADEVFSKLMGEDVESRKLSYKLMLKTSDFRYLTQQRNS